MEEFIVKEIWLTMDHCRSEEMKQLVAMKEGNDVEANKLRKEIEKTLEIDTDDWVCDKTLKVLEYCTRYYRYVGIRMITPHHQKPNSEPYIYPVSLSGISIFGEPYDVNDPKSGIEGHWPAIWAAGHHVGICGCGNSHQLQINNQLSTGLYKCENNVWYKRKLTLFQI